MAKQIVKTSDGQQKYDVLYDSFDAAGNLISYRVQNYQGTAYTASYTNTLTRYDGYRTARTTGGGSAFANGATEQQYDVNGNLTSITDTTLSANNRTIINDAEGRALYVNQAGNVSRQLIANGEVLALYGSTVDAANPKDANGAPLFTNVAEFNFGYQPINGSYPAPAPGAYTLRPGDTLESIARSAFGDAKLWYAIAEANGVQKTSDLKVGQTLTIPSRVAATQNNATGFGAFNSAKVIGDTTPNLPQPQASGGGGGGCGGIGKIITVIVAIVATIATAGALAGASAATLWSTGASVMMGGAVSTGIAGAIGSVATAALAAGIGSVASQGFAVATGIQEKFSWKQVALSAVSGGATAGVAQALGGAALIKDMPLVSAALQAAVGNTATQAIGVMTGLQQSFSWRGVAAAGVGAAVGTAVSAALGTGANAAEKVFNGTVSGIAGGTAAALMRGGRVVVQQIGVDAFGSAIGNTIAESGAKNANGASWDEQKQAALDKALRNPSGLTTDDAPPITQAQRYAQTFGGDAIEAAYKSGPSLSELQDNADRLYAQRWASDKTPIPYPSQPWEVRKHLILRDQMQERFASDTPPSDREVLQALGDISQTQRALDRQLQDAGSGPSSRELVLGSRSLVMASQDIRASLIQQGNPLGRDMAYSELMALAAQVAANGASGAAMVAATASSGRARNNLRPIEGAEGAHSAIKRTPDGQISNYAVYEPNPMNPTGFQEVKRVDVLGRPHVNPDGTIVATPHVSGVGIKGVRPANPWEMPK
jgi:LysM repeat protein